MISFLWSVRWVCGQDLTTLRYVARTGLGLLLAHSQGLGLLLYVQAWGGGPCEEAGQYVDNSNKHCLVCSPSV